VTLPEQPFWIGDDPKVVERVHAHLGQEIGVPLCDSCIARAVAAQVADVRKTLVRLAANGACEQGLWWCGRCATKAYVTIVLAAHGP
jgi:hypothetical protein